jgi:Flp pilus assembly protein TadD
LYARLKPDEPRAYKELAAAHFNRRRFAEAAEAYQQALRLKADYADTHLRLGDAFLNSGREAEALAAYKEAVRLKPADAAARFALARLYAGRGETAKAKSELAALEKLNRELAAKLRPLIQNRER